MGAEFLHLLKKMTMSNGEVNQPEKVTMEAQLCHQPTHQDHYEDENIKMFGGGDENCGQAKYCPE